MFPSLQQFTDTQHQFQSQLANFEQGAQQGFPLSTYLSGFPGGSPSTATGSQPQNATTQPVSFAGNLANKMIFGPFSSNTISRLVAGVLGIVAIAGAIYLFKPEAVQNTIKRTAKGVAIAS